MGPSPALLCGPGSFLSAGPAVLLRNLLQRQAFLLRLHQGVWLARLTPA